MSRGGEIRLPFGAEERTFRLGVGEWRKIQEKSDCGPPELLARLAPAFQALAAGAQLQTIMATGLLGRWRVDDVREPIYQGLIGGGLDPTAAGKIVRELVDERPFLEPLPIAYQVVYASFSGVEDEPMGEPQGEPAPPSRSPVESSASPTSTGRRSRPASGPTRSTAGASGSSRRSPTTPPAKGSSGRPSRRPPKN